MIEKISYRDQVWNILLKRMKSGELKVGVWTFYTKEGTFQKTIDYDSSDQ